MPRLESEFLALLIQRAQAGRWPGTRRKRLSLKEVKEDFRSLPRADRGSELEAMALSRSLSLLEKHGHIQRMVRTDGEQVPLPLGIHLLPLMPLREEPVPARRSEPLHHELFWLDPYWGRATAKQRAAYRAISDWHHRAPDLTPVPLRERALEIFGFRQLLEHFPFPEKALDGSGFGGPLFTDKAELHQLVRAFPTDVPLLNDRFVKLDEGGKYTSVGRGDTLLVVENSTTYWSLVASLEKVPHRIGWVAWGLGASFVSSVKSIRKRHEISEILYFGDLDASGLWIPHTAARRARAEGLPEVRPASALYGDLLERGRPLPGKEVVSEHRAAQWAGWLGARLARPVTEILVRGERVAQEWVGFRHLSRSAGWYADLG